jgi:hypothetical protein
MTTPGNSPDLKILIARLFKQLLILAPIVVGIIHQFLMFFFGINRIYVFLKPPEYISPYVTVEIQWWFILLLVSSIICFLTIANRLRPYRLIYPFYIYVVFLLIFVKPII